MIFLFGCCQVIFTDDIINDAMLQQLCATYDVHLVTCLCVSPRLKKDDESLTIPNVNEGDEGTYACTVKSEIDQDSASARLIVLGTLNIQNSAGTYTAVRSLHY